MVSFPIFVNLDGVAGMVGLSPAEVVGKSECGNFPSPIYGMEDGLYWFYGEIIEWLDMKGEFNL